MAGMKDDNNRVREWETGLPSAADLTPLSHSLISRVLARAFCIPSSTTPHSSSADVVRASQSTLQLLQQKPLPSFPLPSFDPYSSHGSGAGGVFGLEEGMDEDRGGHDSLKRNNNDLGRRSVRVSKGGWEDDSGQERDAGCSGSGIGGSGNGNAVSEFVQAYYWPSQGVMPAGTGQYGSLGSDQGGYGGLEAGSESARGGSLDKSRKLADTESEDVDSADGPDGNTARTLKRPRLVWTPQLHKRFVDAVGHLGIKNAVPKTIMQLMNVEGLTRENVASHLQKYRLYLKRMQGLSTEGPSASDPLFASAPLPINLTPSPQFFPNHHHLRGENGVSGPFSPPPGPLPRTQGTLPPGLGSGATGAGSVQNFGGFEHHPYNVGLVRTTPQKTRHLGEHRELLVNSHSSQPGSPPQQILTLFPPSGR